MRARSFALFMVTAACTLCAQTAPPPASGSTPTQGGKQEEAKALLACGQMVADLFAELKIPDARGPRFQGKVSEATALPRRRAGSSISRNALGRLVQLLGHRGHDHPCRRVSSRQSFPLNVA